MRKTRPTVLVVEDNDVVRKIAMINLQQLGVQTHAATNGLEAVSMFNRCCYDLIFMDIAMPGMDGLQATELIRQAEQNTGKRVPIIAMTAGGSREDCRQAGMDDYILKPPDYRRVLRKWLPHWFESRRA